MRLPHRSLKLLPLVTLGLCAVLPVASASGNPAPLNGIWTLSGLSEPGAVLRGAPVTADLVIVDGQLHGTLGCGRYEGTLDAARNALSVKANLPAARAGERCLYAVRGAFLNDLNAARQYTVSRDHLVLFSGRARLTFTRLGFVTPARK